jgi:hypothetical protein
MQQQQKKQSFHTPDPRMCSSSSYVTTAAQVILKLKDKSGFGTFSQPVMMVTLFEVRIV